MKEEEENPLFPGLPTELSRSEVARLLGLNRSTLIDWEEAGLLTPAKNCAHKKTSIEYSPDQLLRAGVIKKLREEDWPFSDIRHQLLIPGALKRQFPGIHASLLVEVCPEDEG